LARFEEVTARQIRFVGEQDGPPERELKKRLSEEFCLRKPVARAYLSRAQYEEQGDVMVVLAIRAETGSREELAKRVGQIFASFLRTDVHLDILFLTDTQEPGLAKVCKPFYSRPETRRRWYWPFGSRSGN
jgi:hypothetical protein